MRIPTLLYYIFDYYIIFTIEPIIHNIIRVQTKLTYQINN